LKQRIPAIGVQLAAINATTAAAQNVSQAGNAWFTEAQATLEARLAAQPNTGRARNVIIMISDGNGVNSNYGARVFAGQQAGGYGDDFVQPQEAFPNLALVKTYNTNAQTPDSAGTATAILTGVKTKSGVIGVDEDVVRGDCATLTGNAVTPLPRIMSDMGKETGIVTTTRITHATPAAGYANTVERNFEAAVPADCTQQTDINGYCGRGSNILGLCMGVDPAGESNTGKPELAADGKPYTVAAYLNGGGSVIKEDAGWAGARPVVTREEATAIDYQQQSLVPKESESHSGPDVAAYAEGPWSHLVNGTVEQNYLFHVMQYAATVE